LNVEPKRENKTYIAFIIASETELISRETEQPFMDFIVELQDREEDVIAPEYRCHGQENKLLDYIENKLISMGLERLLLVNNSHCRLHI